MSGSGPCLLWLTQKRLFKCLLPERTTVSCRKTVQIFDKDLVFRISAVVCIHQSEVECESFNVVSSIIQIFFLRDVNLTYFFFVCLYRLHQQGLHQEASF